MSSLNDHYFMDPETRQQSLALARSGIQFPEETKLRAGSIVYRIAHSDRSFEDAVAGAWWMTEEAFSHVKSIASKAYPETRQDRAFRSVYRQKLAVPSDFGSADLIVRGVVLSSLRAWTGRGKPIPSKHDSQEVYIGAFEIAHLCIPGLKIENPPGSKKWVKSPAFGSMLQTSPPKAILAVLLLKELVPATSGRI